MEELFREIIKGKKKYDSNKLLPYDKQATRGEGTKAYLIKRIDLLREKLLETKKSLNK